MPVTAVQTASFRKFLSSVAITRIFHFSFFFSDKATFFAVYAYYSQ